MIHKLKKPGESGAMGYSKVLLPDGTVESLSSYDGQILPDGAVICTFDNLTSQNHQVTFQCHSVDKSGSRQKVTGRLARGDATFFSF